MTTLFLSTIALSFFGKVLKAGGGAEADLFSDITSAPLAKHLEKMLAKIGDNAIDPATGLPRNHDLQRASLDALREATLVVLLEADGQLAPDKPWIQAIAAHIKAGKLFHVPLIEARGNPERQWLAALQKAITSNAFEAWHDQLHLNEDDVRRCFRGGPCELAPVLGQSFLNWARLQAQAICQEPPGFATLVNSGWTIKNGREPVTLMQAYCLFFREHLKHRPEVFRIFVADHLTEALQELAKIKSAIGEIQAAQQLVATKADLAYFQQWSETQLGELKRFAISLASQLEVLTKQQAALDKEIGEVHAGLLMLGLECQKNNELARQTLDLVFVVQAKLDYLVRCAGLSADRFLPPAAPKTELELLQARHRAVDLVSRDTDMADLWAWLLSIDSISARLLVGKAGTGKTRLAFELLLQVNVLLPTWKAGVVTGRELHRFIEHSNLAEWRWDAPTLLVVDYAQTLAEPLETLLTALTVKSQDDTLPPLRLLLLERSSENWFTKLLQTGDSHAPCEISDLFHPAQPVDLSPIPTGKLRRTILEQILYKAAPFHEGEMPKLPPEDDVAFDNSLSRDLFAEPLSLYMAALAAAEIGLSDSLTRSRPQLAKVVAKREIHRIERYVPQGNDNTQTSAKAHLLRHLAACATMERGMISEELTRAITEERTALRLEWVGGEGNLAETLQAVLPGNSLPVTAVEPDFVGEALILEVLAKPSSPQGTDRWDKFCDTIARCFRRDPRNTAATLLHMFQNFGYLEEYGETLLLAVERLITVGLVEKDLTLLLGIESALPHETIRLARHAAQVTQAIHDRIYLRCEEGMLPELARLASNLSARLSKAGQLNEAIKPAQEAVEIRRRLVVKNPDAYNPDLAASLVNLTASQIEIADYQGALTTAQEADQLCRHVAGKNPAIYLPYLAMSLNNHATLLSELGDIRESIPLAREAVNLNRLLASQNPDRYTPDFAMCLHNLANRLSELGEHQEALVTAHEAVGLYKSLASLNPDAYLPYLAGTLSNLGTFLSNLGQVSVAYASTLEAVNIHRHLVAQNPNAYTPVLATSLNNLAIRLNNLDRPKEALPIAQEALNIYQKLAEKNHDAYAPEVAKSLNNLANILKQLGQEQEAFATLQKTVSIYRLLAQKNPVHIPNIARSLYNLANHTRSLGNPNEALSQAKEAVDLCRQLYTENSNAYLRDLGNSLGVLGNTLEVNEKLTEALSCFREGVEILTPHFAALPQAFAGLITNLARGYLRLLDTIGREPDDEHEAFLIPVMEILQKLEAEAGGSNPEPPSPPE